MSKLNFRILNELKKIRTPIISDAIELFGVRPRNEGSMDGSIHCILPNLGVMVGYACTGKIFSELPQEEGEKVINMKEVLKYINSSTTPSIMVIQDLDQYPKKGCTLGDLSASMFKSCGCIGAITNGNVRDIDEVEKIGFHLFASGHIVGHSYVRFVEIGTPVKIGGLFVKHGDILHADKHGVLLIPEKIDIEELLKSAKIFLNSEKLVINSCNSNGANFDNICQKLDEHNKRCKNGHLK